MEAKDRYKAARRYAGINQSTLADKAGVTQASISDMETGRSKRSVYAMRIAACCGVSAEWLSEGIGAMLDGIEHQNAQSDDNSKEIFVIRQQNLAILLAERFTGHQGLMASFLGKSATSISRLLVRNGSKNMGESLAREFEIKMGLAKYAMDQPGLGASWQQLEPCVTPSQVILDAALVSVSLLEEVSIGGRNAVRVVRASPTASVAIPRSAAEKANSLPEDAIALEVSGDGMSPIIPDGAIVAADRSKTAVVDGGIYALDHGGIIRLKYLYRKPGGGLILRSFKRDEHADEHYSSAEIRGQNLRVVGRVFWYSVVI